MTSQADIDAFIAEVLKQIGEEPPELEDLLVKFQSCKAKTIANICGLKDTLSKRNELVYLIEELSLSFYQLSVAHGCQCIKMTTQDDIGNIHKTLEQVDSKLDDSSKPMYSTVTKAPLVPKVQTSTGKSVNPERRKAIIISPINPTGENCDSTKKKLLAKIKPADLGIKPDRILKSGTTNIRLEAKEINPKMINNDALKKVGLKAEIVGKLKPRIAVFGIPSEASPDYIKCELMNGQVQIRP